MRAIPGWSSAIPDQPDPAPGHSLSALFEGIPMALALIDAGGRVISGNEAMAATAGDGWHIGMLPGQLAVAESEGQINRAVSAVLSGGEARTVRVALRCRPDQVQDVRVIPLPPLLGAAAMLTTRDIREQERLERQVAASARLQAVGQLAGGVAHDFNNLLTGILGLIDQMLESDPDAPADRVALEEIRRNAHRGARLVGQLLAFARQQPQRRHLISAQDLVDELRPLLLKLLGPAITLDIDSTPGRLWVMADPGQLEQVIVNLAVNARDAMAGHGHLAIRFHDVLARDVPALGHQIMPLVDHVGIEVTDTGSGIPPDILGKIFEPFFTTKPLGQGTGLGLSTVYGIIKQSDGFIFAQPGPDGRGTRFEVYLPGHPPEEHAPERPAALSAPPPAGPLAVLLVEDEPSVRKVLTRGLERKGCRVTAVEDADAALALLRQGIAVDILLSDVMMPGMDGVTLAMHTAQLRPEIRLVLMSGYAELPRHREAKTLGVRFLSKPFALDDLMLALAEARLPEG